MRRIACLVLLVAAGLLAGGEASLAGGRCGPNAFVVSLLPKPGGHTHALCRCYPGYLAIANITTYGGTPWPGCRRAAGAERSVRTPPRRTGGYKAETASRPARETGRDSRPPQRETPVQATPKAALGNTAPQLTPPSTPPGSGRSAIREVPVPRASTPTWSHGFPDINTPPSIKIDVPRLKDLQGAKAHGAGWLGEQVHGHAIEKMIERIELGEKISWMRDHVPKVKDLYGQMKASAREHITGVFQGISQGVRCQGSTRTDCSDAAETRVERAGNAYADRESKRYQSWMPEPGQ